MSFRANIRTCSGRLVHSLLSQNRAALELAESASMRAGSLFEADVTGAF